MQQLVETPEPEPGTLPGLHDDRCNDLVYERTTAKCPDQPWELVT